MTKLLKLMLSLFICCALAPFATAGVYIEQLTHTDAFTIMGQNQPAKDSVQKIWLENDRMASERSEGGMTIIVRTDSKKIYFINNVKKSYMVADLPLKFPPEMEKMMSAFQFQTEIKKTGEKKVIGPYTCEGAEMTLTGFMNLKVNMWVTSDIKLPLDRYYDMSAEMVAYSPAVRQMMDKMRTLGNVFAVQQETTGEIMGAKTHSTTKLVKFEEAPVPHDKFDPPATYKAEPMDFKQLMRQGQ